MCGALHCIGLITTMQAEDWPLKAILDAIIGPCGTDIVFTVIHKNAVSPVQVELKRGTPIYW